MHTNSTFFGRMTQQKEQNLTRCFLHWKSTFHHQQVIFSCLFFARSLNHSYKLIWINSIYELNRRKRFSLRNQFKKARKTINSWVLSFVCNVNKIIYGSSFKRSNRRNCRTKAGSKWNLKFDMLSFDADIERQEENELEKKLKKERTRSVVMIIFWRKRWWSWLIKKHIRAN